MWQVVGCCSRYLGAPPPHCCPLPRTARHAALGCKNFFPLAKLPALDPQLCGRWSGVVAATLVPLLLTAVLFLGPLVMLLSNVRIFFRWQNCGSRFAIMWQVVRCCCRHPGAPPPHSCPLPGTARHAALRCKNLFFLAGRITGSEPELQLQQFALMGFGVEIATTRSENRSVQTSVFFNF